MKEDIQAGTTWIDIMRKYDPDITMDQANYILWNETCFPFDNEITISQIETFFTRHKQKINYE